MKRNKLLLLTVLFLSGLFSSCTKGELVVYGSCEKLQLTAICAKFEELTGIDTRCERYSTGEVLEKIRDENGKPQADVWFGGTTDPYNEASLLGLLEPYEAKNVSHLIGPEFKDNQNCWHGIYRGILGIFWNKIELEKLGLESPKDWDDLTKPEYKGLIAMANPSTSGTGKLFVNTMVQLKGEEEAMRYFSELDKNICIYTKAGSKASKIIPTGEAIIGIGFLHDVLFQIVDNKFAHVGMAAPESGTSYEIGATAILKGCKNLKNAKKFIEFALSPECVNLSQENGAYQFLVIDNAAPVKVAVDAGLDKIKTINYDFEDAKLKGEKYYAEFFDSIVVDDRFEK